MTLDGFTAAELRVIRRAAGSLDRDAVAAFLVRSATADVNRREAVRRYRARQSATDRHQLAVCGGLASAAALTPAERHQRAKRAAMARWRRSAA